MNNRFFLPMGSRQSGEWHSQLSTRLLSIVDLTRPSLRNTAGGFEPQKNPFQCSNRFRMGRLPPAVVWIDSRFSILDQIISHCKPHWEHNGFDFRRHFIILRGDFPVSPDVLSIRVRKSRSSEAAGEFGPV
jgi:hypothetical protein